MVRYRMWPVFSWLGTALVVVLGMLAWGAGRSHAWAAAAILGVGAIALGWRIVAEAASATSALVSSVEAQKR
jgi:hypothetical protein